MHESALIRGGCMWSLWTYMHWGSSLLPANFVVLHVGVPLGQNSSSLHNLIPVIPVEY